MDKLKAQIRRLKKKVLLIVESRKTSSTIDDNYDNIANSELGSEASFWVSHKRKKVNEDVTQLSLTNEINKEPIPRQIRLLTKEYPDEFAC